jgi:hypothetical protein
MSRPSIFTVKTSGKIVRAKARGRTNAEAEQAAGIGTGTLRNWIRRGESGEEPFASFRAAVRRAEKQWARENIAALAAEMRASAGGISHDRTEAPPLA